MVAMLAPGEVVSYGDIAHDAGRPGAARAAGVVHGSLRRRSAVVAGGVRRRSTAVGERGRTVRRTAACRRRRRAQRAGDREPGGTVPEVAPAVGTSVHPGRTTDGPLSAGTESSSATAAPSPVEVAPSVVDEGVGASLDLDEGHLDVGECSRAASSVSSPSRSPSVSTSARTPSMASLRRGQIGGLGREVDGRQLVETHHVVGDDDLGGDVGEPAPWRRRAPAWAASSVGGFVAHLRYPTDHN